LYVTAEEEIYPIALLTDDLKNDETETRIKSMRRLKIVAQALGPEQTRSKLLPFLQGMCNDR
jgi:serine/threonine-protein phosphatase 2A regulatory subunit A